jgi:hypothetical protein
VEKVSKTPSQQRRLVWWYATIKPAMQEAYIGKEDLGSRLVLRKTRRTYLKNKSKNNWTQSSSGRSLAWQA